MQRQCVALLLVTAILIVWCSHPDELNLPLSSGHEDAPFLHLMQESYGIYSTAVDPNGILEQMVPQAGEDLEAEMIKPSPLAFGEAELEDSDSIHLLQTARVVPSEADAVDTQVIDAASLQDEVSALQVALTLSASKRKKAQTPAVPPNTTKKVSLSTTQKQSATNDGKAFELADRKAEAVNMSTALAAQTLPPSMIESSSPSIAQKQNVASDGTDVDLVDRKVERLLNMSTVPASESSPFGFASAVGSDRVHRALIDALVGILITGFFLVFLLLFMIGAAKLGRWCFSVYRYSEENSLREYVEGMKRAHGIEIVDKLVSGSVYDCAIMRPLASRQLIRLEARVEEAASGFCLWTPLTQQACVRFTATVSRQMNESSQSVPMSYHNASIDFVISLLDAPHVRIELEGSDLSTFDMSTGRMEARRTFDSAARHMQEFAMTYQIGGKPQPAARFRSENAVLEFQETSIVLGTSITVIGELQRNAVGTLLLRPALEDNIESPEPTKDEAWRTSWESPAIRHPSSWPSIAAAKKPWLGKVWASDDPSLLGPKHKHAKYEPTTIVKSKASRDCSSQISGGFVHLISSGGK